ncbi:Polyribonucleotide nucleotidyltransferase [Aliarcobacter thereius]|uniref:Polyribonucleotide nucleotidyltransferase n=2 Tax=Aliarcobacter thereius TaxID=544718 RepID=A0A1C0B6X6_9BACT|nr:polyribonucleotide nucleotidyltransferase [Aliarcobacter thereius]OCL86966.1 Polyribonucleotide nucleotidyltransferase [Aliarcobacter thereius]OCL91147.1 Polyribonucleotide nucleotidyltransferase [Aliarcobacter thereius]OCL96000.1 Polyribonucleotide nucleotidyltransferase [Aliarcobacter thereius LMG 24486]OCL99331.1 Polyribonucleotide nucleotidyltransferase [Aliarcobacter thereius]QBF16028.1 polynucleotide phosphorylase [Aliarcobacter thereius LMG 24486]
MAIICEIDLNNQKEIFEFDKVAKQANGSVLAKVGDCVVLAAVACEFDNPVSEDFTPLTVQYIEKTYASAKLPGGFIKREAKPSDFETLTSRVIDRSLRPLFPKGFVYPTTITVMVLSADKDVDLQTIALNAANAALYTSNLPIKKSVCGVRVGKIDDKLVLNPNQEDLTNSTLDLYIAGSKDELLMIEMKSSSSLKDKEHCANEMNEEDLVKAISFAQEALKKANIKYEENFEKASKERVNIELIEFTIDEKIISYVRDNFSNDVKDAIKKLAKSERATELKELAKKISQNEYCTSNEIENSTIYEAVNIVKRELVRAMIVDDKVRADGRGLKDVRPISIETNILPKAHSSCLFTRGETQALVVGTIAGAKDGQMYEVLTDKATSMENFMVHYNFPGFSVGEAKPIFGVGRRELGHGNLAKKALEATISKNYNETVRLVSEILESNGSSSMATVCGGSLALKAAKIPISDLVAGVAMGMVVEDDKYSILTDIMGLEDHDGDMDFKVAGTKNGITALQMDIKLGGIELSVLTEALNQAKEGRLHILNIMEDASKDIVSSKALPKCEEFEIDSSKMMIVIGKGGSTIKEIIEKYSVNIDLDRDNGIVKVSGEDENKIFDACEFIKNLVNNSSSSKPQVKNIDFEKLYSIDEKVSGKVERVVDFGAFISLEKGGEGLLHISKISKDRIEKASDVLSVGQELEVKVLKVQKDRIELGLN